ncbi:Predicted small secreted protein [Albimonas donghaensis]|uniref:Predicted small secreted protein n=1 Tax=Albimonas donghaensis TaxID=356660 RepID=A0A1H2T2U4_9RHOB|nr:entericidin A/B family lipoprotein [Albimonas donghaensis]MAS44682.1 entericidin, EcnA/B family [Paracoccaceae bacterium]MBR27260.1 entericidin, EcnA/B family [Paracoccaceae bacterium]SDW38181.1 Predicted small secreted protein [Albimonas donghaensis]|tara:strand:+ start:244 stop:417 length:174 start_codon:yes stop_codon:yes gene_type:complete
MTPTRPILSPARIAAAVLSLGLLSLAACNTVEGIGEDISSGGKAVSETADKTQKKLP